jgi:rubrerythrin
VMKLGKVIIEKEPEVCRSTDYYLLEPDFDQMLGFAETLQLGIQKEQAAFGMYMDLYALAEDDEQKLVMMAMAEEEIRHKVILESQYNELMK